MTFLAHICLKSWHNRYLSAGRGERGSAYADAENIYSFEVLDMYLISQSGDQFIVAFKSHEHGTWLKANGAPKEKPLAFDGPNPEHPDTHFQLYVSPFDNKISLRNLGMNCYMCAEPNAHTYANRKAAREWESWEIGQLREPLPGYGGSFLHDVIKVGVVAAAVTAGALWGAGGVLVGGAGGIFATGAAGAIAGGAAGGILGSGIVLNLNLGRETGSGEHTLVAIPLPPAPLLS